MSMVLGEANASLSLRLLGPMEVLCGGKPLEHVRSRKAYWLLALLGLHANRELSREWVAGIIWPDSDLARETMRRTLTDLRSALGSCSESLVATKQTICLRISETDVDALRFDALILRDNVSDWDEAIALYRGALVEGCGETWFEGERVRRADAFVDLLERAASAHGQENRFLRAVAYLRSAIKVDPFREKLYRDLMQALAASGTTAEARLAYRDLRQMLHESARSEPSPETTELFRKLISEASRTPQPAPEPPDTLPPHFPRPLTRLIGRERELDEVAERFSQSRLVTIAGTGGIGKTRLAIESAVHLRERFADGIHFIDLSPVSDPARVARTIARLLDIREAPGTDPLASVISHCRAKALLLVLDNCEHLLTTCSQLAGTLLQECSQLSILATSRQALRITGEVVYSLSPLPVPDKDLSDHSPALQLFLERASAVRSDFRPTPEVLKAASLICRKLDGVPLALELAAARTRSLSVEQVAERLQDRFRLLRGGDRTHPLRQQSLSALIDWSYDLLEPSEQVFFSRLSLFEGGCNLEAAAAVCHFDQADATAESVTDPKIDFDTWEVLDLLDSLVDKSLVYTVHYPDGETRYRMLETLREYGREKVEARGEVDELQRRHAAWFLTFAESLELQMRGSGFAGAQLQFGRDHDNFRLALQQRDSLADRLRLASALLPHWYGHGLYAEGRQILESALAETAEVPAAVRCKAMKAMGDLCWAQGDLDAARIVHTANLETLITTGDRRITANTWNSLGVVNYHQGKTAEARACYSNALAILRTLGEPILVGNTSMNLAIVATDSGDCDTADRHLTEAEAVYRSIGHRPGLGKALHTLSLLSIRRSDLVRARSSVLEAMEIDGSLNDIKGVATGYSTLGEIALEQGEWDVAEDNFRQSQEQFDQLGARRYSALLRYSMAEVARGRGDWTTAERFQRESLQRFLDLGDRYGLAHVVFDAALQRIASGERQDPVRLLIAAKSELDQLKAAFSPRNAQEFAIAMASLRETLGDDRFAALECEGKAMSLECAVELSGRGTAPN